MQIRPASNNQLKLWRKLQQTKYRKKEGLFLAEGERCVEQIVENGFLKVESIILEKGYRAGFDFEAAAYEVERTEFESLSDTDTPQGILAICKVPEEARGLHQKESGLMVAFDAVQDPGNVGTIIRTAAWFGAAGLLIGNGTADPFHPKVVRSTAGATGALDYAKGDLAELLGEFENVDWQVYLMDGGDDSINLQSIKPEKKSILVIGNEGNGISDHLFLSQRTKVGIPGHSSAVESLNAAIATGIGLYHMTGGAGG
ncbi:TrmH family RNA methyltransferase [Rhodohalobacter sp. 8-1]|uniref:TrmH family RNA methyltransferase n=1 Tax=Rhodohalobacter sp. 8-1 TaxID=3131972 RepID=UPI0030EDBF62